MQASYINKSSKLVDLNDEVHQRLGLDPQKSKLSIKFFSILNVSYVASCLYDSDRHLSIFIEMTLTSSPIHRSPLDIDIVPQIIVRPVPQFRILHRMKTFHARFCSNSGSNHFLLSHPVQHHNDRIEVESLMVDMFSKQFTIKEIQIQIHKYLKLK